MSPAAPDTASPPPRPLPLSTAQRDAWVSAQALWGVSLHDAQAHPHAHQGTFAWFSFPPQVWFDLDDESARGLDAFLESIFAHEIGHHVLSPSTRQDSLKIRHQMARALTASGSSSRRVADLAGWCSNVWSDMLVNVRVAELQRLRDQADAGAGSAAPEPEMIRMWRVLSSRSTPSRLWWVVLRAYEIVWSRPPGTLCVAPPPAAPVPPVPDVRVRVGREFDPSDASVAAKKAALAKAEAERQALQIALDRLTTTDPELDAGLLADAVRTFGADPVSGALRFGMIAAAYFVEEERAHGEAGDDLGTVLCGGPLGEGPATPGELVSVLADARLRERPEHPAAQGIDDGPAASDAAGQGYDAARTLSLYGASDPAAVLSAWYQAEARPWVKPLVQVSRTPVVSDDSIPGALEEWSVGDDLGDVDWMASLSRSLTVVPGVTTLRRDVVPDAPPPARESVQLDLYIDSSGSMPSPSRGSAAVLAGTILMLSVLQGGGRIRVTSFSGPGQVAGMTGFTRDRTQAFASLTTFFGGGTTFPLDLYASRYRAARRSVDVRRHVVVLSDDGLHSLFGEGQPGLAHVAGDVRRRLDSATLIVEDSRRSIEQEAGEAGYDVLYVDTMADAPQACVELAHRFVGRPSRVRRIGARRG